MNLRLGQQPESLKRPSTRVRSDVENHQLAGLRRVQQLTDGDNLLHHRRRSPALSLRVLSDALGAWWSRPFASLAIICSSCGRSIARRNQPGPRNAHRAGYTTRARLPDPPQRAGRAASLSRNGSSDQARREAAAQRRRDLGIPRSSSTCSRGVISRFVTSRPRSEQAGWCSSLCSPWSSSRSSSTSCSA